MQLVNSIILFCFPLFVDQRKGNNEKVDAQNKVNALVSTETTLFRKV